MEKIRKDVWRLAENLAAAADLDADEVYGWLCDVGKIRKTNPKNLDIRAADGRIWLAEDPAGNRMERLEHGVASRATGAFPEPGTDYEGLILARQENLD